MAKESISKPHMSPRSQDKYMISLAYDEAEYQIKNHKASSQVITHFLKLGSQNAELETEKLRNENLLLEAKIKATEAMTSSTEIYSEALQAFKRYSGNGEEDDEY